MPRLASERSTHLTRAEIGAEALRQFDAGPGEPSIRSLAAALRVAPTAIYHHFSSQAAIRQAAVELVWREAGAGLRRLLPDPMRSSPNDLLVAAGLATRDAWLAHHRLWPYMAATPDTARFTDETLGVMAALVEGLGLREEDAAAAFHTYVAFMVGAVLYAAANKTAKQQVDTAKDVSIGDPGRDRELFELGLRRLVQGLTAQPVEPAATLRVKGRRVDR
jgi:AcrR family transcriptional regulator